jgi:hypothetical protein
MGKLVDDAPPSSLMDSTVSPKVKIAEGEGVGARSLAHSTLEVEGHARAPRWGPGILTSKFNYSHRLAQTKQVG